MPKRKHSEEERRLKKIRKLERKLRKYKEQDECSEPEVEEMEQVESIEVEEVEQVESIEVPDTLANEKAIPNEIQSALGNILSDKENYGPEIHSDIIKLFENILLIGLTDEQRDKITKQYTIPVNAKLLDAPKLNKEITGLLKATEKNRDERLQTRQQDVGLALGNICQAIGSLINDDFDKLNIIKMLSDSARLLSNIHYQYTLIRRKLVSPHIDKTIQINLQDNKRTEFLYSDLDETAKTTLTIKRISNSIQKKPPTPAIPKNFQGTRYQHPPHQQQYRRPPHQHQYSRGRGQTRPRYQTQTQTRQPIGHHQTAASRGRARYP